jgi:hypothetical protein
MSDAPLRRYGVADPEEIAELNGRRIPAQRADGPARAPLQNSTESHRRADRAGSQSTVDRGPARNEPELQGAGGRLAAAEASVRGSCGLRKRGRHVSGF